jgi:PAS domain S-box-containing protein
MKSNAKILACLGGMVLFVMVGVVFSLRAFSQIERAGALRQQSYLALNGAGEVLSALKDAETGYRGYLLTGEESFLQPYLMVRDSLGASLAALRRPGLNEAAAKRLDAVAPLVTTSLDHMQQNIDLRRQGGLTPADMTARMGQGKHWMDLIRVEFKAFGQIEETEAAQNDAEFQARLRNLFAVICATSVLTLALALLFAILFYREAQRRIKNLVLLETRQMLEREQALNLRLLRSNATLEESEEKLSVTFNSIGDAVLTTDAGACLTGLNAVAEHLTGWTQAEASGHPVDEVFHIINQETREPATIPVKAALEHGTIHGLANHTILIARDGTEFAIADSCAPIRNRAGLVVGAVMVFRDVTGEYAAQQSLRDSEEKLRRTEETFRLMVESVVDYAIVMLDPEGRVLTWNSGAQRIKGFSAEDIVGQPFSRFYPRGDAEAGLPQLAMDAVAASGRFESEGWRVRKDGSAFWANVILTAIRDQDGVLRGFAKLTQDLTERRTVERELLDSRSLAEQANLAKSNFLSSMSHELRSPLNAILGFAQLLESDTPPPRPAQQGSIDQILRAGWHLLTLINEILDLAKVESGQMPMSREPVALAEVLDECLGMIQPQAAQRGIRLIFPPPGLPCFVLADRTRVKQVLLNLLSNAVKYNVKNGMVEVRCFERQPGRVRVTIRDLGPGLRPEQMDQLFQPFNRLGQEASNEEGTGIGLVVAKRLVELMEGVIGVESTVGVGSEFWFELLAAAEPRLAADAGEGPAARPEVPAARVSNVLYVEDNPANLSLVEQIIARHPDIHLLTARDGSSGIDLARGAQPKVILMDINLPGMSGFEALDRLRTDPATAHIPVIAISANAMESDIERGMKAGFLRYITKPIKVNEFMEALRVALASCG